MFDINGCKCHDLVAENTKPELTFDKSKNLDEQRETLRARFTLLTGIDKIKENDCPLEYF